MSARLTLDPSSFERLLAAALVIQHRNEQEARYRLLVPDETPAEPRRAEAHSLKATDSVAKNMLESFARYRVRTWITFDSKFTLSPNRALAKAAAPLLVLVIVAAFTLTQVWHRDHFHTVAAASRLNHPSEDTRKAEQFKSTLLNQASHMQVTDRGVLWIVESLSRYEIPALRRQARFGDDSAAFLIGMLYETGHFVPRSCAQAATWVTASANAGNAAAQYNLGLRYRDGDGVPANQDEAEKWLRKAAERQYSDATLALATLTSGNARSINTPPGIADALATGSASRN